MTSSKIYDAIHKQEAKNKRYYYDKFGKPKDIPGFVPAKCKACKEIVRDPILDYRGRLCCPYCKNMLQL